MLANGFIAAAGHLYDQIGSASLDQLWQTTGLPKVDYSKGSIAPVSILSVARFFSILAAEGMANGLDGSAAAGIPDLVAVLQIWSGSGEKIFDAEEPESRAVISPQVTYLLTHILGDDAARSPTLGFPNIMQIGRPSASIISKGLDGGTWAAGYTIQRVAAIWIGPVTGITLNNPLDGRVAGGLWHALMQSATDPFVSSDFLLPPGIVTMQVCAPSGMLPSRNCPVTVPEVFISGNEPVHIDDLFQSVSINRETGMLATAFTPVELIEQKVFIRVPQEYKEWARKAGIPLIPENYDVIQLRAKDPAIHITSPEMMASLKNKIEIRGTASSQDFKYYRVQVGRGLNPGEWIDVGVIGERPVVEGLLATWDTRGLNGLYIIRVQVVNNDSTVNTAAVQVTLDNPVITPIP
jgi:membrane carboxypeptidase/penicillin-binding protein PbpC